MNNPRINKNLKRTVLITGVTSDIGKEIAARFAENGWGILGHYFSSGKKANTLKKKVDKCGVNCHLFKADLSSKNQLYRLVKKLEEFDISSVINNAGTYLISKHFSELTIDDISRAFMVNAFAPMVLASRLFERMKKKNFGRIVNISSIAAKYGGSAYSMHYGCSKRALEGLTKTLAREGARHNVLVNTIRPGVIDTDFHKKFPKNMTKRIAFIPLGRIGAPKDIAEMAYYLGSEKNSFITSETIAIAGGE